MIINDFLSRIKKGVTQVTVETNSSNVLIVLIDLLGFDR